jgi:hypothetical protein
MANAKNPSSAKMVALRVINAEILRNFEMFGKMDPYVIVKTVAKDGLLKKQVSRTWTHWDGHMAPRWDHTCRAQPVDGVESIEFYLYEDDVVGKDDLCGIATVKLQDLVEVSGEAGVAEIDGPVRRLDIKLSEELTGYINVQAVIFQASTLSSIENQPQRRLPPDMFETPATQLNVSAGTATFYKLRLRSPGAEQSVEHYVGKDLRHALDEVSFYEEMRILLQSSRSSGLSELLGYAFDYAGISSCEISSGKSVDLLVMRNLQDGYKRLRLIDIKLGSKTAQAGWQGKSRLAALRQSVVDGMTNSCAEGFRLEGFEHMPPQLMSMDPLIDFRLLAGDPRKVKKARRIAFQMMHGPEILMHFLDLHNEPDFSETPEVFSATELSEIVGHEILQRMIRICLLVHQVPVPQKWIGSSIALGFECAFLPERTISESAIRKKVQINIFDWGRSELNTLEKHSALTQAKQHDRSKYWAYYVGGLTRLTWDVARVYRNRFTCPKWHRLYISVVDFDSMSSDDFIGRVVVENLKDIEEETIALPSSLMTSLISGSTGPTLTYSIKWQDFPASSRLKGRWQVRIVKANNLPRLDKVLMKTTSDPYVEVIAVSLGGSFSTRQRTSIATGTLNPVWNEVIELPEVKEDDTMEATLSVQSPGLAEAPLEDVLLSESKLARSGVCCGTKSTKTFTKSTSVDSDDLEAYPKSHGPALEKAFLTWESRIVKAAAAKFAGSVPDDLLTRAVSQESVELSLMLDEIREAEKTQAEQDLQVEEEQNQICVETSRNIAVPAELPLETINVASELDAAHPPTAAESSLLPAICCRQGEESKNPCLCQ